MLFTEENIIFKGYFEAKKCYSARQLLKRVSLYAVVLFSTRPTATSTTVNDFLHWQPDSQNDGLLIFISQKLGCMLMKLLHITLNKCS